MFRFAPFITANMDIGSMRVALINYIVSRQKLEQFIVRIADSNKDHELAGKDQELLDLLKNFAIEQDQLFYQSDNLGRHQQLALSLLEQKKAFVCICTDERIEQGKKEYSCSRKCLHNQGTILKKIKEKSLKYLIRIKEPKNPINFTDKIQGEILVKPNKVDSFVILNADGTPTYNFATACDDMLTDISLVIDDVVHIDNIPRQIHLRHSLGYMASSEYAHIPNILNESGKKLELKDDGSTIKWMLEEGFLPDAIINYLLQIGNTPPMEIFRLPDALKWFSLDSISKTPEKLDIDKLRLLNRKHLQDMDDKALSKIFAFADADIGKLLKVHLKEVSTVNELEQIIKATFNPKACDGKYSDEMIMISDIISKAPMFNNFEDFKHYIMDKSDIEEETLLAALRILLAGLEHGPELHEIYPLVKAYITEIARCKK